MKKLFTLTLLLFFFICNSPAQQSGKYIVWFTNGSSIECVSFEQTGEDYLRIVRLDGRSVTYSMSVVDRVMPVRSTVSNETPPAAIEKMPVAAETLAAGVEKTPDLVYNGDQTSAARSTPVTKTRATVKAETAAVKEPQTPPGALPAAGPSEKHISDIRVIPPYGYGGEYEWVRVVPMKNPFTAGITSAIIPGLGQFYNGQIGIGFAFMGGWLAAGAGAYIFFESGDLWPVGAALAAAAAGTWIWSIIQASNTSKKINIQRGYALGNGKFLNAGPAVLPARTFAANSTYHCGMALRLTF